MSLRDTYIFLIHYLLQLSESVKLILKTVFRAVDSYNIAAFVNLFYTNKSIHKTINIKSIYISLQNIKLNLKVPYDMHFQTFIFH